MLFLDNEFSAHGYVVVFQVVVFLYFINSCVVFLGYPEKVLTRFHSVCDSLCSRFGRSLLGLGLRSRFLFMLVSVF